jgi:hypothetical protein
VDIGRVNPGQFELGARPGDAKGATLGGVAGWQRTVLGTEESPWGKLLVVAAERNGYQYGVRCYFEDQNADEKQCQDIASSLAFEE